MLIPYGLGVSLFSANVRISFSLSRKPIPLYRRFATTLKTMSRPPFGYLGMEMAQRTGPPSTTTPPPDPSDPTATSSSSSSPSPSTTTSTSTPTSTEGSSHNKKWGIGIIGTGWGVTVQVPAFRAAGWEVVALCARTPDKAAAFGEKHAIPFATHDPKKLIAHPDVHVVSVVLPPHTHEELSILALEHGKHVLCDKPTCLNVRQAQNMFAAAQAHPKQLALIDHELRFLPTLQEAKTIIASGTLGKLLFIKGEFCSALSVNPEYHWWYNADMGGGILGAIATHMVDNASWIAGQRVTAVKGSLHTFVKERPDAEAPELEGKKQMRKVTADDSCNLEFRFSGGAIGFFRVNTHTFGPQEKKVKEILFAGEKGTMHLVEVFNTANQCVVNSRVEKPPPGVPSHTFGNATYLLATELRKALEAASHGSELKLDVAATFEDGLYVQRVIDGARESHAAGGKWIELA